MITLDTDKTSNYKKHVRIINLSLNELNLIAETLKTIKKNPKKV